MYFIEIELKIFSSVIDEVLSALANPSFSISKNLKHYIFCRDFRFLTQSLLDKQHTFDVFSAMYVTEDRYVIWDHL